MASSSREDGAAGFCYPRWRQSGNGTVKNSSPQTCHKAGLPPDAWRHGAKVWRFEAEVFGE